MVRQEDKETYQIDNREYTVITRTIENAKSIEQLYQAFSKYAIRKLNMKVGDT